MASGLYEGKISEFIDWATGLHKLNGMHVDEQERQISGKSIRELLQDRLLKPFYAYDNQKDNTFILFPSVDIANSWAAMENDPNSGTNIYDTYKIVEFAKPATYTFDFVMFLNSPRGTDNKIESDTRYYVVQSDGEIQQASVYYKWKVVTVDSLEQVSASCAMRFNITNSGVTRTFTIYHMGADADLTEISLKNYLTEGDNYVQITFTDTGDIDGRLLGAKSTFNFYIDVVVIELKNVHMIQNGNMNIAAKQDKSIIEQQQGFNFNFYFSSTIKSVGGKVAFEIYFDGDLDAASKAFRLNDEEYRSYKDDTTQNEWSQNTMQRLVPYYNYVTNDPSQMPTFVWSTDQSLADNNYTLKIPYVNGQANVNFTQSLEYNNGAGTVYYTMTDFITNLATSIGQHSVQVTSYIYLTEEDRFYSNTIYYTFVTNDSNVNARYVNISYDNNQYSNMPGNANRHMVNYTNRVIRGTKYQKMNIDWAPIFNVPNLTVRWRAKYQNTTSLDQTLTTQTFSSGGDNLLSGSSSLTFTPLSEETITLNAFSVETVNGEEDEKILFSINVDVIYPGFDISEADGYVLKLSGQNKSNGTSDSAEWNPINSNGGYTTKNSRTNELAKTTFNNISFKSATIGWINNALTIYGKDIYAMIDFEAMEMPSINNSGHTIEIDFESIRVQNDDDVLIYIGANGSGNNIIITPTYAAIRSGTGDIIKTNYKVNERMRIAFVWNRMGESWGIEKAKNNNQLIYIITNGVLERAIMPQTNTVFSANNSFILIGNNPNISIPGHATHNGSGIKVYSIKVYNKALSVTQALHNYILEQDDKNDIIARNTALNVADQSMDYDKCCNYIPTFKIYGNLNKILNTQTGKDESCSNVNIDYTHPTDSTRNFTVINCQIRKHGQSTLSYPVTSMKFWLNKTTVDENNPEGTKPAFNWENGPKNNQALTKNRYQMKKNSFREDSGVPSIPANKYILQANFADSSGVHNGAIERMIQNTWYNAKINIRQPDGTMKTTYVLRTPPQLFTSDELNLHNYKYIAYKTEMVWKEDPSTGDPYQEPVLVEDPENSQDIEVYTLGDAYSHIFVYDDATARVDEGVWNNIWARIKNYKIYELPTLLTHQDYSCLSEAQQDTIDAEFCYMGYGKLHSDNKEYDNMVNKPGHPGGHIVWQDIYPSRTDTQGNKVLTVFPYQIGIAADSMPVAVFKQFDEESDVEFLGQYVFMEDKKSDETYGEGSIYAYRDSENNLVPNDPFGFWQQADKSANNGVKKTDKSNRIWNNKRVLRIEVLNIDTVFTSFLSRTESNIPYTQPVTDNSKSECDFDAIVRTEADANTQPVNRMNWETDFELIYPDPDDIQEDQDEENIKRAEKGLPPLQYYEKGSVFRDTTQPWVDFFYWAVGTFGDQAEFERTATQHLDLWKMAAYYIFFLRFGLVDSVERNAQWKTYDWQHWHLEPWDMDIALGNNNQGVISFAPPMTRNTPNGAGFAFSGSAATKPGSSNRGNWILNALEAWPRWYNDILPKVAGALADAGLTYDNANKMFDDEYANKWSESIYNISGHFKYVESALKENGGGSSFLTWLQGSRSSHRHWWLYESMSYYDTLWNCGEYKEKSIEIYTDKEQRAASNNKIYITVNKDCQVNVIQNREIQLMTIAAKINQNITLDLYEYSLSTKVPLSIYGSMYIQKLDMSEVAAGCARLYLDGAYSSIAGGTLYELNIGVPYTKQGNNYVITACGLKNNQISGVGILEHLQTLTLTGQTQYTQSTLDITGCEQLENLYAAGTGITALSLNNLYMKTVELPAYTPSMTSSGEIRFNESVDNVNALFNKLETLTLSDTTWDNIYFYASAWIDANGKGIRATRFSIGLQDYDLPVETSRVPYTIKTLTLENASADTTKSKEFVYEWLYSYYAKYYDNDANNALGKIKEELSKAHLYLKGVNWSLERPNFVDKLSDNYDDDVEETLLMTFSDLRILSWVGGIGDMDKSKNYTLPYSGYIQIGDQRQLSSDEMAELQEWFGSSVFSTNSSFVIGHTLKYIALSVIPEIQSQFINKQAVITESGTPDMPGSSMKIAATYFGDRTTKADFAWIITDLGSQTGSAQLNYRGSLKLTYNNDIVSIQAYESIIGITKDDTDNRATNFMASLWAELLVDGFPQGIKNSISIRVNVKAWPTIVNMSAKTELGSTGDFIKIYDVTSGTVTRRTIGIKRDMTSYTINTEFFFQDNPEQAITIMSNGASTTNIPVPGKPNTFQKQYTYSNNSKSDKISLYTILYYISYIGGTEEVFDSTNTQQQLSIYSIADDRPNVRYTFTTNGLLTLMFDNLPEDTPYDFTVSQIIYYRDSDQTFQNSVDSTLRRQSITLRLMNDSSPILLSTNEPYACIESNLTSQGIKLGNEGRLYKMDLYMVTGALNFSQTYNNITTFANNNYDNTVFAYMPNITALNLSNVKNCEDQYNWGATIVRYFDFTKLTKLETLNMSGMTKLSNQYYIDLTNCVVLKEVSSKQTDVTFLYPKNTHKLETLNIGNPKIIELVGQINLQKKNIEVGLKAGNAKTVIEHIKIDLAGEDNRLTATESFQIFAKIFKPLRN